MSVSTQKSRASGPIRILVAQLSDLGTVFQSLMALRAARQLYPELEIHLLVRENASEIAKKVPWIHTVIELPANSIADSISSGRKNETESLQDLAQWASQLTQKPWDFLINWSYSDASSFLAAYIPARVKLGYTRRSDQTLSCADGWSQYIQAIVKTGLPQNIHLTDILTTQLLTAFQIHMGDPVDPGNAPATSRGFFLLDINAEPLLIGSGSVWKDPSRKWVGIQICSGSKEQIANWARFASYILKRHPECNLVILGTANEKKHAQEFLSSLKELTPLSSRVLSLVGKSNFDGWASVISRCQWLVSNGMAPIHLASILGTRVIHVGTKETKYEITGPYGNGHYVLVPSGAAEISAEAIYGTWAYASSEWSHRREMSVETHFGNLGWTQELQAATLIRTRIRNSGDGGGVVYEKLPKKPMPLKAWSSQVMGQIARGWYCGWLPPMGQELSRDQIHPALIQELRALDEATLVLTRICAEAKSTANELQQKSSRLRSTRVMGLKDREELTRLGRKLIELDQLIFRTAVAQPALQAFAEMTKVSMHNLKGERLADLGRESAESYQQLNQGANILRDWIKHTLSLAKPIALRASAPIGTLELPR